MSMDIGRTKRNYQEVGGGCWTAASKGINITPTKMLRTYLNWTKVIAGDSCIYLINCYV